ncbi:MAG: hypothetical protein MR763_05285 [Clostridiales bacterium]|nr:hypothetical protein [Clostridiales bacterium]
MTAKNDKRQFVALLRKPDKHDSNFPGRCVSRQPELQFAGRSQADNGQYIQTGKDRIVKKRESGAALLTKRALRGRLCIRDVQPFPQIPNPEE